LQPERNRFEPFFFDGLDMAWALHTAARGISREQIEQEILNSRDLSKKVRRCAGRRTPCGPPARRSLSPPNKRTFAMENLP